MFVPGFVPDSRTGGGQPLGAFFHRIASFSRLIMFDKRGTGMSDPFVGVPTLEERIDDVRAVMETSGPIPRSSAAFPRGDR